MITASAEIGGQVGGGVFEWHPYTNLSGFVAHLEASQALTDVDGIYEIGNSYTGSGA